MYRIRPEAAGVSPAQIRKYLAVLEENNMAMHSVMMAKGDGIFFEKYYAPYGAESLHRLYSVSKSFVSIAIGFLLQEGKISLDDPVEKYFAAELEGQTDKNLRAQTIRHMLMMSTAKPCQHWFDYKPEDRVRFYFQNDGPESRPSGTIFDYDSTGSFVLCALVERLTGQKLLAYLRDKLFDRIGVTEEIDCLTCPGGHSWGDSAILCTTENLMKVARFVLNYGMWDGEQILDAAYLRAATAKQIDNDFTGETSVEAYGYGYQFWRTMEDSFFMNGMGSQFAVCVPHKDMIFVCTADNQGRSTAKNTIIRNFFEMIADTAAEEAIPANEEEMQQLRAYADSLSLLTVKGPLSSELTESFSGKTYHCEENVLGIREFTLEIGEYRGTFRYEKETGEKEIVFGLGCNEFGLFPEDGYSDRIGTVPGEGRYRYAASAAFAEPKKLHIRVQIIDKYLANLDIVLSFRDDKAGIYMTRSAEDFLWDYQGFTGGTLQ